MAICQALLGDTHSLGPGMEGGEGRGMAGHRGPGVPKQQACTPSPSGRLLGDIVGGTWAGLAWKDFCERLICV